MAGKEQIGEVSVGITADPTPLKQGLNEAKAETEKFAATATTATGKVSTGFHSVGSSIKSATLGVRTFVGAITSTIGIVTRLIGVVGLVIAGVQGLVSAFRYFTSSSNEAAESAKKQREELERLHSELIKGAGERAKQATGVAIDTEGLEKDKARVKELDEQIIQLRKSYEDLLIDLRNLPRDTRGAFRDSGVQADLSRARLLTIEKQINEALKERDGLNRKLDEFNQRDLENKRKIRDLEQTRIDLMSEQRRLQAQQAAYADRMAADISRMAAIAEATARQRFNTGPRGVR